ncbi:hypothetical protein GCM10023321_68170 [Pseudonocardia eucalypti]|uniref:Uncharacterized protein n=1 Tax=Pseudonocardia eucalypti TaxID=648755 RepID=A0ABP9R269_9PSEU
MSIFAADGGPPIDVRAGSRADPRRRLGYGARPSARIGYGTWPEAGRVTEIYHSGLRS